jgi:hypothetical protein
MKNEESINHLDASKRQIWLLVEQQQFSFQVKKAVVAFVV